MKYTRETAPFDLLRVLKISLRNHLKAGQVQHRLPSKKVQQNGYALASSGHTRYHGLQAVECAASDFHVISGVEIWIDYPRVASADDFAKLSNGLIRDDRPVVTEMNHFGDVSRGLDSTQL